MKYRDITQYKYELTEDLQVSVAELAGHSCNTEYLNIYCGVLLIRSGYMWDGASGPAIDDKHNMRASLVHDALYQLMRGGLLPQDFRKWADSLYRALCISAGMSEIRADYHYAAVRAFGAEHAEKQKSRKPVVIEL